MTDSLRQRRAMLALLGPLVLACAGLLAACADFSPIGAGVCGNGVVEGDLEDCDLATPDPALCSPPGSANACRFVCSSTRPCPTGSTCVQSTSTCVRQTGSFATPMRVVDGVNATNIDLSDTDGDGSFETFVSYYSIDATRFFFEFPRSRAMGALSPRRIPEWPVPPRATRSLAASSSDPAGRCGVFAPIATGVTMVHRDESGTVQPDARFGAISIDGIASTILEKVTHSTVLRRKLGRKGVVRDGLAFVSDTTAGVVVGAGWQAPDPSDTSSCTTRGGFLKRIEGAASDIVSVGGANIVEASPCEELVVVFRNAGSASGVARYVESCGPDACPITTGVQDRSIDLVPPDGQVGVLTEAAAADIDGDGHVDLVAAWRLGSAETSSTRRKTFTLRRGQGNGTFLPSVPFTVSLLNTDQELLESAAGLITFRERRDFDGVESGRTFAIISDRVLRFDGTLVPQPSGVGSVEAFQVTWPTGASRWESPIAEDLDRDGVLDVVLTNGPRIYVLRGNGVGSFGTTVIEAGAPIRSKSIGDFDGDGLLDVAITRELFSSTSASLDGSVALDVAYGMGAARLGPWLPVLSIPNPDATLVARRKPDFTGADAVIALGPYTTPGAPFLVELAGDGTQGGLFPATRPICSNAANAPIEANSGTVFRARTSAGLASFVFVGSKRRPLTNGRQSFEGVAVAAVQDASIDGRSFACSPALSGSVVLSAAAGSFCGDDSDELFLIHRGDRLGASLVTVTGDPSVPGNSLSFNDIAISSRSAPAEVGNASSEATLADLDGDGDLDVLVRLGNDAGIAWNETPLASVSCSESSFRYEPLELPTSRKLVDVDLLARGTGTPPDVVVLYDDGFGRYRRASNGTYVERSDLPVSLTGDGGGPPSALEFADVDGDGFEDAVIADTRGIRIHYGLERERRTP